MTRRLLALAAATALVLAVGTAAGGDEAPFEVWAIDQSNTTTGGGTLYIYDGPSLAGQGAASPEVVDLGQGAEGFCVAKTGTVPTRPHMLMFSPGDAHAILSYVASGHVLFMDAATRTPVACIDVGAQAHAAFPSMDGRYVVVANQNGKLLQRIWTNWSANTFTLDPAALNLGAMQDAQHADNAPICPIVTDDSQFTFVTLRGGGLYVVRSGTEAPMAIVASHGKDDVHPNGCGGVQVGNAMYINSGGGTATNPLEADLYKFVFDGPTWGGPALVFNHDARGFVDSHGATSTKHGRYVWVADRAANRIVIVDTRTDSVVNELDLTGALSSDPAPDLLGTSPSGNRVFFTMRGPNPLTGNAPGVNNAVGATPGIGVLRVEQGGADGVFQSLHPITHRDAAGVERADPHGIGVRRR
jgi:DNA-binding beta-propeller fold protein YncE